MRLSYQCGLVEKHLVTPTTQEPGGEAVRRASGQRVREGDVIEVRAVTRGCMEREGGKRYWRKR